MNELQEYMIDVKRFPTMSWEVSLRHFKCIKRLRREVVKSKLSRGCRRTNIRTIRSIRKLICEGNLKLVFECAKSYRTPALLSELIGEGNLGLMDAIDKFDPYRGFRFSTYACKVIKSRQRNVINSQSMVLKRGASQRVGSLIIAIRGLQEANNFNPTDQELADWLNENGTLSGRGKWKATSIAILKSHHKQQITGSLSHEFESGETLSDMLEDKKQINGAKIDCDFIWESMARHLIPRDFDIMQRRFEGNERLKEIAKRYGYSRERIRQIETDCLKRIRIVIRNHRNSKISLANLLDEEERQTIRRTIAFWISYPDPQVVKECLADGSETLDLPIVECTEGFPTLAGDLTNTVPEPLLV